MPRRACFVFHLEQVSRALLCHMGFERPEGLNLFSIFGEKLRCSCHNRVSMPRRACFVFHLSAPEHRVDCRRWLQVSMPRRAYFVFHHKKHSCLRGYKPSFNAPKGLFCFSPSPYDSGPDSSGQASFNAPKGLFCISPKLRRGRR